MKMKLIGKSAVVAEIEKTYNFHEKRGNIHDASICDVLYGLLHRINTLEVKEVNIADMADDYYEALMQEADWMDEGTIGHCRLAYYTGCKDVLNKIRKGE